MVISSPCFEALSLNVDTETWPLKTPLKITGYTFSATEVIVVRLAQDGCVGYGEASGIYYRGDTAESMRRTVEGIRATIEAGASRDSLLKLLPPGGARNAVDCALGHARCYCGDL